MNFKSMTAIGIAIFCTNVYAESTMPSTQGKPGMSQSLEKNKQEGEAFLTANKTKPGVITLADGLQYKIIKPGTGPKPAQNSTVSVEYTGTFIDGKEFDSSKSHGGPASFGVGQVISGWTEALKLMPAGSIWELYIPSDLAYGDQGAPPTIGPGQTLIFTVKLLDVK